MSTGRGPIDWSDKDARLIELRERGLTFLEIGKVFECTASAVRRRWHWLTSKTRIDRAIGWKPSPALVELRQTCAAAFGITEAQLMGKSRVREIAWPRQAVCYIIRAARPHLSFPCIARMVGGRDHSTIIYACRIVRQRMAADPDLAAKIDALVAMFARGHDVRQHDAHVIAWREFEQQRIQSAAEALMRKANDDRRRAEAAERDRLASDDEFLAASDPRRTFCGQCDRAVRPAEAARCSQRLCGMRALAVQERCAA